MSTGDCRGGGGQKVGKHFKGVENFLKRVAFNLGNSPSQTEVKIVSCIPIDVSDLQQKIICLEKQLEDSRTIRSDQKRVCNTAICESTSPVMFNTGVSCNMLDIVRCADLHGSFTNTPHEDLCKNQLQRQSNVSIVTSPDPIEMQQREKPNIYQPHANMTLYDEIMRPYTIAEPKPHSDRKSFFRKKKKCFKPKKPPRTHLVYYTQTNASPFHNIIKHAPKKENVVKRSYLAEMIDKQYKPRPLGGYLSEISDFTSPVCRDIQSPSVNRTYEPDVCSCCHGTFHNIDNQMMKSNPFKVNGGITDGGFYDSTLYDVFPVKEKSDKIEKFNNLLKRKRAKPPYDIRCWPEDVRTKLRTYPIYNPLYFNCRSVYSKPDIRYRRSPNLAKRETLAMNMAKRRMEVDRRINTTTSSCSINFGSVYPKVINAKLNVDKDLEVAETPRTTANAQCLTNFIIDNECQTNAGKTSSDEKTEETLNQIKNILQSVLQEIKITKLAKSIAIENLKKDAIVQNGESQHIMQKNKQEIAQTHLEDKLLSDIAGNLPSNIPGKLQYNMPGILQADPTGNIQSDIQGNNAINISSNIQKNLPGSFVSNLQSSYPNNAQNVLPLGTLPGVLPKNMNSSRLLDSFTYSSTNLNPYPLSCSKQLHSNHVYYPGLRCFHNFPLILQPPGRQQCSCCRHNSLIKSGNLKQGMTIATNTDTVKEGYSKETEKLIKEIYKSMALNMGVVHKDNSWSEYEPVHDFASHLEKSTKRELDTPLPSKVNKVTNVVQAVSELFRKKDMQVSSESPNTATESRLVSREVSTGSQLVTTTTTDVEVKLRKDRLDKFLNPTKQRGSSAIRQKECQQQVPLTQNAIIGGDLSSDTETDITFVPRQPNQVSKKEKKEKPSLLSKMFNSVKLFRPRKRKRRDTKENKPKTKDNDESSSDSDDYQTIYSQKLETTLKPTLRVHNLPKRRTHSKISYKQAYPRERSPDKPIRRSPYLEQEHRRHWNEKLMFHSNDHKHSSERPYFMAAQSRQNPYHYTYEARAVSIDPRRQPMYRTQPVNDGKVLKQKQAKDMSPQTKTKLVAKKIEWLKKHKMGIHCGEQWKKLFLEG